MGVAVKSSGSQTATLDGTHTLLSTTDAGIYTLSVDLDALAVNSGVGEILELFIDRKVRTGDSVRQAFAAVFVAGLDPDKIACSFAVVAPFGADFKLRQPTTAGATGRAFPWSVEQIDA